MRVFSSLEARKYTLPPSPQSPPEGPPKGIPLSLLPEAIPSPHFPDAIKILTSS
jgi:hypothetical protein